MGEPTCRPLLGVADVGMVQRGEDFRFALKPGEAFRIVGERLWQHLQRHVPVELGVAGAIHLTHPAFADLGGDFVAPYALESHLIRPETDPLGVQFLRRGRGWCRVRVAWLWDGNSFLEFFEPVLDQHYLCGACIPNV